MKINHKNSYNITFFVLGTLLFIIIGSYLSYTIFYETPHMEINTSKILTYGKPRLIIYVQLFILIVLPWIIFRYCVYYSTKHKKSKFIFLQLFSIGIGLIALHNSYYLITENNIYYNCFLKSNIYTLSDVKQIQFNFIPEKNSKIGHSDPSCEVEITLNDKTHFKLNNDPKNFHFRGSDDFLEFDKQCINAEKNVNAQLVNIHKDILTMYWGPKTAQYILKNYTPN